MTFGKRLLVIDDEEEFSEFVRAVAAELGYAVTVTSHATGFQTAYREHTPDVIITDIVMPGGGLPKSPIRPLRRWRCPARSRPWRG
jgi:CheY-like chemotaxis protein